MIGIISLYEMSGPESGHTNWDLIGRHLPNPFPSNTPKQNIIFNNSEFVLKLILLFISFKFVVCLYNSLIYLLVFK